MEEKKNTSASEHCPKSCSHGWVAFAVGLVLALILGWRVFPSLMQKELTQPIAFNHQLHLKEYGISCSECHIMQGTGNFVGLPSTETCAVCHFEPQGSSAEEAKLINDYIKPGREIRSEWLIYQKQPDNVFFSHSAHYLANCTRCHETKFATQEALCIRCHLPMHEMTTPPVYRENRLSGYSEHTMIMWECESCHAQPEHLERSAANNACFVCHK